jgi:sugar phosphate isomerase/epimerase
MRKNIFVSTTFIKDGKSFLNGVKKLKSLKIFNIEIGSNHCYEKKKIDIKKLKCNFLIHNYFPVPKKNIIINIASIDEKIRKRSIKQIKSSIKFTKKNNAKLYTFHPGFLLDPKKASNNKKNYDFIWESKIKDNAKNKAWLNMIKSLKEIIVFSKKLNIKICIETQGSIKQKDKLLLQKPSEFRKISELLKHSHFGINLNLAHLNLASKAFKFEKIKFINQIKKKIFAIEASHNFGKIDNHLPLRKNTWYWKIIKSDYFKKIPIILEFRNTSLKDLKRNYLMAIK